MKCKKLITFGLILTLLLSCCLAACKKADASSPQYSYGSDAFAGTGSAYRSSAEVPSDGTAYERQVVRTARIIAQTKDFDTATAEIAALIAAQGGYTETSSQDNSSDARSLRLTARIPADKLDAFLNGVEGRVHVTSATVSSDDITLQYYDTAARLETLRAEKQALDAMLETAATTDELLKIHERLFDVMEEIDSLQTRLDIYRDRVAYATVTITLYEVVEYEAAAETFGTRAGNAVRESWHNFGQFWLAFLIFLIYALPALLVLGVIALVVILLVKRAKKAKPTPAPGESRKED